MTIDIKIPTSWNQLTSRQLTEVAYNLDYYHSKKTAQKKSKAFRTKLYYQLTKQLLRTNNWVKVYIALRQIPPTAYKKHAEFLFEECARTIFLPKFKVKGHIFHPPAHRLKNITIEEFSLADSLYVNFRKTADIRYLDNLCATLYRRAGGDEADIRKPFNKILIENDVKYLSKLKLKTKLAILYAYNGCRNSIAAAHPHVFPPPSTAVDVDGKPLPKEESQYVPFGKLIQHKINYDPSKLERTLKLNAWSFLGNYENELIEIQNL